MPGPVGPAGDAGLAGGAIPAGGLAGEHLLKDGNAPYATRWSKVQSGRILHKSLQGPWNGTGANAIWTVALEARPYLCIFSAQGHASVLGMRDIYMQLDAVLVANSRWYANVLTQHNTFHTATFITTPTAGNHTFTVHNGGSVGSDTNDYGFLLLMPL